jgi:DNA-directed RNA polymerase
MYLVYSIDQIRHLMNEPKKLIFPYNNDRRGRYFLLTCHLTHCQINQLYSLE